MATGMVEGVCRNVNEGYGTTSPLSASVLSLLLTTYAFTDAMNAAKLPGVRFIPVIYKPSYSRFKDKTLMGTQLVLTNAGKFEPLELL